MVQEVEGNDVGEKGNGLVTDMFEGVKIFVKLDVNTKTACVGTCV